MVVDCSYGNQGLNGYANTNDVYVHVGVITSSSSVLQTGVMFHLPGALRMPAAHATSLGNNKYSYTIHNIRNFFGVPAGESILKLAILFPQREWRPCSAKY